MNSLPEFLLWLSVIFPLVFSAGPGNVLCAVCLPLFVSMLSLLKPNR